MPLEALLIPDNLTDSDSDGIDGGTECYFILFFYHGNDEFLTYCYIYQFIPCKMAGWGKLREKERQNNYTFIISSICLAYGFPYL